MSRRQQYWCWGFSLCLSVCLSLFECVCVCVFSSVFLIVCVCVCVLKCCYFSGVPPTTPGVDERPTDVTRGTGTAVTGTGPPMVPTDQPGKGMFCVTSEVKRACLYGCVLSFEGVL